MLTKTNVKVKLTGTDGNAFVLIGTAAKALKRAGHADLAKEMTDKAFKSGSYHEMLAVIQEYVEAS